MFRKISLLGSVVLLVLLFQVPKAHADARVYIHIRPPIAFVEHPPLLRPGWVWRPGYHRWRHTGYSWVRGGWARPPHRHAVWVAGRWNHDRRGYYWTAGYWARR
jgi:WXXGXW repeat (2 copies)